MRRAFDDTAPTLTNSHRRDERIGSRWTSSWDLIQAVSCRRWRKRGERDDFDEYLQRKIREGAELGREQPSQRFEVWAQKRNNAPQPEFEDL